ncbi:MAG: cell division topological specificity factor MinE [Clostridium sp.]|nr:cell division topological specificity factor MinE [Clostridium sp.]
MKENIFSSFYSKVMSFFTSGKEESESARDTASNRLKLVLMQDRSNLDGATMQKMREQLITVISKYIEIDTEALDLNLEGDGEEIALMLNIPVIRARTPEEIAEIEAEEEKAKESEHTEKETDEESENNDEETSEEADSDEEQTEEENSENQEEAEQEIPESQQEQDNTESVEDSEPQHKSKNQNKQNKQK